MFRVRRVRMAFEGSTEQNLDSSESRLVRLRNRRHYRGQSLCANANELHLALTAVRCPFVGGHYHDHDAKCTAAYSLLVHPVTRPLDR